MPVPLTRTDAAYVAALQKLERVQDTDLYLGLVHLADGLEGAEKRIAAASSRCQGLWDRDRMRTRTSPEGQNLRDCFVACGNCTL